MHLQRAQKRKGFWTLWTTKRFFTRVNSHMQLQSLRISKWLCTMFTCISFITDPTRSPLLQYAACACELHKYKVFLKYAFSALHTDHKKGFFSLKLKVGSGTASKRGRSSTATLLMCSLNWLFSKKELWKSFSAVCILTWSRSRSRRFLACSQLRSLYLSTTI